MSVFTSKKLKGVYRFDFWHGGHRFSGTTGSTTRKAALKFEDAEREKAKAAVKAMAKAKASLAIDDVADRYWLQIGQHHVGSETTSRDLARLVKYFGATKLMTDIHDTDVAELVAWRRGQHVKSHKKEKPTNSRINSTAKAKRNQDKKNEVTIGHFVSPATVNRSTTEVLKKLFMFCKGEGVRFDDEPTWKKHKLPEPEERVRELHDHETKAIDANMRDDYKPIFDFVMASGWRRGAAVTLQWSEVNWSTKTITKLGKGNRRITLRITPSIHAILWPLVGHHDSAVFTYVAEKTKKNTDGDVVIVRGQRYPITAEGLKTRWRRTRDDAGLIDFRFHDFRHDTATKLLRQTGNLKIVQKMLGHKRITTTGKYAHVLDDDVANALEALNASRRVSVNIDTNTSGEITGGSEAEPIAKAG